MTAGEVIKQKGDVLYSSTLVGKYDCIPFGTIWTPFGSSSSSSNIGEIVMERCDNCGAYGNIYNASTCVFCGKPAPSFTGTDSLAIKSEKVDAEEEEVVFLVLDQHLTKKEVESLIEALEDISDDNANIIWGLLIFSSSMSVFHLQSTNMTTTAVDIFGKNDELSFQNTNTDLLEMYFTSNSYHFIRAIQSHYGINNHNLFQQQESNQQLSRKEILRQKRQARLSSKTKPIKPTKPKKKKMKLTEYRCTYEAIALVMDILQYTTIINRRQRILLVTNGTPNTQKEEDNSFQDLGQLAWQEFNIGIDVCTMGSSSILGIENFLSLVQASQGHVWNHHIDTHNLSHNLSYLLKQTHVTTSPGAQYYDPDTQSAPPQIANSGAILELHMSRFMKASHYIGPAALVQNGKNNDQESVICFQMNRYDPLASLSLLFDIYKPKQQQHAYFQWIVSYTYKNDSFVKVLTHQLPIATDRIDFMDTIDSDIIALLLAKEAVHRTMTSSSPQFFRKNNNREEEQVMTQDAKYDLDTTIHLISKQFRLSKLQQKSTRKSGMDNSVDFAFPPELAKALHQLYHLRRGPLLGTIGLQSLDDCKMLRHLFLRLPLSHCLKMMEPTLWKYIPDQKTFVLLPPITLALWNTSVLAIDHYNCLFVWSGKDTFDSTDSRYSECRNACEKHLLKEMNKLNRFPMCRKVIWLKEGNSMSRNLTTRLAPAHADPPQHQTAYFPDIANLSSQELLELRSKFKFYDSRADASFRKWFWNVVSATYKSQGIPLTE